MYCNSKALGNASHISLSFIISRNMSTQSEKVTENALYNDNTQMPRDAMQIFGFNICKKNKINKMKESKRNQRKRKKN